TIGLSPDQQRGRFDGSGQSQLTTQHIPMKIRWYSGSIVVLTGGTTGVPKAAGRKPSILNFMPPFLALLTQLQLDRYQRIFIGTPIFHGFGLASLFLGVLHGAEVHLMQRFDAVQACQRIAAGRLELI
ncbi:MAG: AMP-binding protein, partial [Planctomycetaceae bacterium]